MSTPPVNPPSPTPAPVTPPVGPPAPPPKAMRAISIPVRNTTCIGCQRSTSRPDAIDRGWVSVSEVNSTGTTMSSYYVCNDCQIRPEYGYLNAGQ